MCACEDAIQGERREKKLDCINISAIEIRRLYAQPVKNAGSKIMNKTVTYFLMNGSRRVVVIDRHCSPLNCSSLGLCISGLTRGDSCVHTSALGYRKACVTRTQHARFALFSPREAVIFERHRVAWIDRNREYESNDSSGMENVTSSCRGVRDDRKKKKMHACREPTRKYQRRYYWWRKFSSLDNEA